MKVSFIVVKGMPLGGGIEKYTEELGSRLVARGHEVVVYSMSHYGAKEGDHKGMSVSIVPTIRRRSMEKIVGALTATVKCCAQNQTDLVHYHAFGPAMWCFIPRMLGKKVITQGHGLEWKRSKWNAVGRWFLWATEWPSVRFAHAISAVSDTQKRYLQNIYNVDSTTIPTGITPPKIIEPNLICEYGLRGNDYILFAARLVREKGAHYLINAYNCLKTNKKLVICGDANYEEGYKKELRKLAGENPNILFTGFVTGQILDELFSNCYCFVLPSEIEGLPTVLLEAMSYRGCCLASDIPENLEALQGHGYTFKSKDVGDLEARIQELLDDPHRVESVKEAARKHVLEHHNWDTIADRFETFYQRVLKGKGTS